MARPPARRFMLPGAGQGSSGLGYTGQPIRELPQAADEPEVVDRIRGALNLRDEPEALDAMDHRLHIDERAKLAAHQQLQFETKQREQARRLQSFEERLVTAQQEARVRRIDVTREVRMLKHMQQAGKQVRHLEQRLFALERKACRELDEAA